MARRVGKCINGCPGEQVIVAHGTCRSCYNGRGLTKELEELVPLRKQTKPLYLCGKIEHARILLSRLARKGYLFAANVYPQDELRGVNKGALFALN